jgi:glycine/sarcosine N-methyltransferase
VRGGYRLDLIVEARVDVSSVPPAFLGASFRAFVAGTLRRRVGIKTMTHEIADFYESLADYYHLIFEDWNGSIHRQAKTLDLVISRELPGRPLKILDCACGIGTQALGFASMGHSVVGSDLSEAEVRRAEKEAHIRGLDIKFYVSDMTGLREIPDTRFDVVAALDNALPHLTPGQLGDAIKAIASRLTSGGLFIASIRDYDLLLQQRPAMQEPAFFGSEGTRRIVHQVWDWIDADKYKLHLYITMQAGQQWTTHHFVSEYRCMKRQELSDVLRLTGFSEPVWLMPPESGYYQPLVLARWPPSASKV